MSNTTETEVFQLLGRIATAFSDLEFVINLLLAKLVGKGAHLVPLLIERLPFNEKIKRCRMMAEMLLTKEAKTRLGELMKRAEAMWPWRNEFIHGHWTIDARQDPVATVATHRWEKNPEGYWGLARDRLYSLDALRDEYEQVRHLVLDLITFSDPFPVDWDHDGRADSNAPPLGS